MERFCSRAKKLYCLYCGTESLAFGHFGICRACEAPLSQRKADVSASDNALVAANAQINKLCAKGDLEKAAEALDTKLSAHSEPGFLLAAGLFYIRYSNDELKKIRYDLDGFMEDNAVHRENSEKLMLHAKMLLNHSVKAAEKHAAEEGGMSMEYIPFLAEIKLGHVKGAEYHLGRIKRDENTYLKDYAEIVMHAHMKKAESLLEHCDRMIRDGKVNLNLFYYIGYALFLKKAYADARMVLEYLSKVGDLDAAKILLSDMDRLYG